MCLDYEKEDQRATAENTTYPFMLIFLELLRVRLDPPEENFRNKNRLVTGAGCIENTESGFP